jgi:hypothetical protein
MYRTFFPEAYHCLEERRSFSWKKGMRRNRNWMRKSCRRSSPNCAARELRPKEALLVVYLTHTGKESR